VLDFSYNELETVNPDTLGIETLERVNLRGNKIYHLDAMTFASCLTTLLYLDVRDNRLVYLDKEFFDWVSLEEIEIVGNPWDCKCFDNLLQILKTRSITYTKEGYFDGERSLCVALNPFDCTVDIKHVKKYYEEYSKLVQK